MINKFLILMFCIVLLAAPIHAQEFTFKQNYDADIIVNCINNGVCSTSASCNITVSDPDNTILVDNLKMNRSTNGGYYNYTLNVNQTSVLGEYKVGGFCKDGSVSKPINFSMDVTPSGFSNQSILSFLIIILLVSAVIIFFGFWIKDGWVAIFGTFGLYFVGLYILRFGIVGLKDTSYTWAMALIILGVAAYISIKSAMEMLDS